jgi:ATP-binding cassette subfamily F protein uup
VSLDFGKGKVLDGISLGVLEGSRIGIVGRNGGGKSTLLRVLAGLTKIDSGRVSVSSGVEIGTLNQIDSFGEFQNVRDFLFHGDEESSWIRNSANREIVAELLGGEDFLDREISPLSGGEKRRISLAKLLIDKPEVLLLDEPTNHLDVEAVSWLAKHLKKLNDVALVVVTHDRWFLDEVCEEMWEVVYGKVENYEGGYSAFVLAKAERDRQSNIENSKRNNLIKKELAWLRRGAPARTAKPKFRIEAANELISAEPAPRDNVELLAFASARLGKTVFELQDADISAGENLLLSRISWNIGPGQRIGLVGVNGAGKTTLLKTLSGENTVKAGHLVKGKTVKLAYLSQHLEELDPTQRVLEAVESVAKHVEIGKGKTLSASQLCERLGFTTESQWTPVRDLSGGERRRLQLTRLLMGEPNVLFLDEPTNDFDVETLAALEDLLDSFAGTILVVSHDRYFLERVCDNFVGLLGNQTLQDLPRGIDQYLELRSAQKTIPAARSSENKTTSSSAQSREDKKELSRIERQLSKVDQQISKVHQEMAEKSTDFSALKDLNVKLESLTHEKHELEETWLKLSESA